MLKLEDKVMAAIPVDQEIFQLLKQAYSEKFGSSPSSLINRLNNAFKEEFDSSTENLIADRTIRAFFNAAVPPKMQEKNLNYLCYVLLDQPSYQEAVRQLAPKEAVTDWLVPYWKHLYRKCSTMRILDMNEPVLINNIYVRFQILKDIVGRRQQTISCLLDTDTLPEDNQNLKRFPFAGHETHIAAIDAVMRYRRLMILGKPGAGKTTFLKYLAMNFATEASLDIVPIFIRLRDIFDEENSGNFANSLTNVVIKEFVERIPNSENKVRNLLENGQCLIMLDGLDEVKGNNYDIYRDIEAFIDAFPDNRFIITCRPAASDYVFNDFTEVEIADFERAEIEEFAHNWFRERGEDDIGDTFIKKLEENHAVRELATNPLLLTILCLTFEDTYDFAGNRYAIYEDAVDTLLRRWDASRRIERRTSFNLSRKRKINLFSEIAYRGFGYEPPKVLWHQRELEKQISQFMQNITSELDPQETLKIIEANYGLLIQQAKNIYSFSHLTFQEYFAAEYIVENRESDFLKNFVEQNLTVKQWREVFILITERLSNADEYLKLIFRCVNDIVKDNPALQNMLSWLKRMTNASNIDSSGWRAYYLAIDLDVDLYISRYIQIDRSTFAKFATEIRNFNVKRGELTPPQPRNLLISRLAAIHALAVDMSNDVTRNEYTSLYKSSVFTRERLKISENIEVDIREKLAVSIEKAKELNQANLVEALTDLELRYPSSNATALQWQNWAEDLRQAMIKYLDVGYKVDLDIEDVKLLEKYIYANYLLLECISGESYSSKELREEIIDNLLLPTDKIPAHLLSV
ncbi:NACHT domain family protein [Calothrix sp. NIES-4071]|nr:NACHT domain family protein [Calothrix sp. NIES-4071]BAZ60931.1 NACHT domain family protein [Calothrix sp. NIES-4105]